MVSFHVIGGAVTMFDSSGVINEVNAKPLDIGRLLMPGGEQGLTSEFVERCAEKTNRAVQEALHEV